MSTVTFLGPQFNEPNLRVVLANLGLAGPYVSVTAGWQEREGEVDELRRHVGEDVADLSLYARTERVFEQDPGLRAAHRERQAQLQEMQGLYALQLGHAKDAARALLEAGGDGRDTPSPALRAARRRAIGALRRLDRAHFAAIRRVHAQFEQRVAPQHRPAVKHAVGDIQRLLEPARAVFVAGGHVAALLNRLRLLGAPHWLRGRPVIAWSAGAMALSECVVLFHDRPPQGAANAEVFDAGLALVPRVIVLPHAQNRLDLHDATRTALFARRFAPNVCATLDAGACLHFEGGRLRAHAAAFQLARSGALAQFDLVGAA
jgi:hypothetical protein